MIDETKVTNGTERIAERTAEIVLSKMSESDNPLSVKCERVLGTIPKCYDFRGIRRWVMCKAWDVMETRRIPFGAAISEAWDNAKRVCTWDSSNPGSQLESAIKGEISYGVK